MMRPLKVLSSPPPITTSPPTTTGTSAPTTSTAVKTIYTCAFSFFFFQKMSQPLTTSPASACSTVTIGMGSTSFIPSAVTVQYGDTITWVWPSKFSFVGLKGSIRSMLSPFFPRFFVFIARFDSFPSSGKHRFSVFV